MGSVDFKVGQKATGKELVIVSFLAGCQSRKRLRFIDARPPIAQAHIMVQPNKSLGFSISGKTVSQQKQKGLVDGVCRFSMTSSKLSTISVDEEKKNPEKAGNESFGK